MNTTIGRRHRWGGGRTVQYSAEEMSRPAEPGWLAPDMASLPFSPTSGKSNPVHNSKPEEISPFASSWKSPKEFGEELMEEAEQFNGFNLIVADLCSMSMVYITNRPKGDGLCVAEVSPGIHVLSNAKLDTPWPKAQRLRRGFEDVFGKLTETEISLKEITKVLMSDTTKDDSELPGIYSTDIEYLLSAIFVEANTAWGQYGTRSTSAVVLRRGGALSFYETYLENDAWRDHTINFSIQTDEAAP